MKYSIVDKKRVLTGFETVSSEDNVAFANAILWNVETVKNLKDGIIKNDFAALTCVMKFDIANDEGTSYKSKLMIQVKDGRIVFTIYDIEAFPGGFKGFMGHSSQFDKLKPEKKPKHQEMMDDFMQLCKKPLVSLFEYIRTNKPVITDWYRVCEGTLKKGMSMDEMKLIYGWPIDKQEGNDGEVQYTFNTFTYIYIKDGVVKSIID